jgi:hypothetical protein
LRQQRRKHNGFCSGGRWRPWPLREMTRSNGYVPSSRARDRWGDAVEKTPGQTLMLTCVSCAVYRSSRPTCSRPIRSCTILSRRSVLLSRPLSTVGGSMG